tara:strand:+ start:1475 stop:1627 length:153 start_codon:yes stop_codon:yes gene_type:complete
VYSIEQPEFGTYLVDSGVAAAFADESQDNGIGLVSRVGNEYARLGRAQVN